MKHRLHGYNPSFALVSVSVDEQRYLEVVSAKRVCLLALGIEERLQLTLENYTEWENELLIQAQSFLLWRSDAHSEAMRNRLQLDRRMVNVLTAVRLYLDQTDHIISAVCGNQSGELASIKSCKNSLYDDHFGYRFMEALRNFVQHCGLPVQTISYQQARIETKDGPFLQVTIAPLLHHDSFDKTDGFKASVLREMQKAGKSIDLRQTTREYVSCLIKLHAAISNCLESRVRAAKATYSDAIAKFSTHDGIPVLNPKLVRIGPDGCAQTEVHLLSEPLDLLNVLHHRNSKVGDVRVWFSSGGFHKH